MSRVLGWLRWLRAFAISHYRLSCLVRDYARERVALKRQNLAWQAELGIAEARIAGQQAEAIRMTQDFADAQDELARVRVLLGRKSMAEGVTP